MSFMKSLSAGLVLVVCASGCAVTERTPFRVEEATVSSVHAALARGELTCVQLTRAYLDRIEAYNLKGPSLRAILTVNPKALETAAELDRQRAANRGAT